jgi:hypothetical protein
MKTENTGNVAKKGFFWMLRYLLIWGRFSPLEILFFESIPQNSKYTKTNLERTSDVYNNSSEK